MGEGILLVALGCGRLPGMLDIAAKHLFVVFGTMDEKASVSLAACAIRPKAAAGPIYFYETG